MMACERRRGGYSQSSDARALPVETQQTRPFARRPRRPRGRDPLLLLLLVLVVRVRPGLEDGPESSRWTAKPALRIVTGSP